MEKPQASYSAKQTQVIGCRGPHPPRAQAKQTWGPTAPGFPPPPSREALTQDPHLKTASNHVGVCGGAV